MALEFAILGLLALVLLFGPLILSVINSNAIAELRRTAERQAREIEALKKTAREQPAPSQPLVAPVPEIAAPSPAFAAPKPEAPKSESSALTAPLTPPPSAATPPAPKPALRGTLERQFGGRAFVWLGGIALALAGFFLVKYSIDTGLLTENVRVILGILFGLALLAGSNEVRRRERLADGKRIAQALAGAGIADLYGSLFAATTLYHMLPSWLGFALMAAVTATALVMSLRYGAPIAALGLIGGYVTPLLIQGDPNAPVLFGYLYLVFGGLAVVIRRQNWHWLSIPAALIAFIWVVFWLVGGMALKDGAWLSLFLAGVGATASAAGRGMPEAKRTDLQYWQRYLAPAGSLLLMALVTYATKFGGFEWAMFGLFCAGAIALAWFEDRTYVYAPWVALAVNLVMILGWDDAVLLPNLATVVIGFASLFIVSGQLLLPRSSNPLSWAGLSAAAALGYYLVAYKQLQDPVARALLSNADTMWAVIAALASAAFAFATTRPFVLHAETTLRHRLQAIFAATAAALLPIGLAILLKQEFLSFALAAEVLALCWINTRLDVPALRRIAQVLAIVFLVLLLPEIVLMMAPAITPTPVPIDVRHQVIVLVFSFGLPAAMFTGASLLLRRQTDDEIVKFLELAAVALLTAALYKLIEIAFAGQTPDAALFASSVFTAILLLLALAAFRVAGSLHRQAALWGAYALAGLALARLVGFGLGLHNPLLTHAWVGAWPLFNVLTLAYAFPAAVSLVVARHAERERQPELALIAEIVGYILGFIYVSLCVRQFYGGAYLDAMVIGSAEIYSYSVAWLVSGIALLFAAVLRKAMTMRVASLAILLLTVGKVFLYDASALTGLWRVVSFLGLGLSLLGLSWFYTRFVFVSEKPADLTDGA